MLKHTGLLLLAFSLSANATPLERFCEAFPVICGIIEHHDNPPHTNPTTPVSMPEPSAIPELALCVAGLGFVALRRRKSVPAK